MAHHLQHILSQWYPARDQYRWVLGTVIHVQGSNYRKTGAMILINELGHYYGLISGGCLEKNLLNDVKKVLTYDRPLRVYYDSSEQGDMPWAMALGCGGRVTILLQPVSASCYYQELDLLYKALQMRSAVSYAIDLAADIKSAVNRLLGPEEVAHLGAELSKTSRCVDHHKGDELLIIAVRSQTHLIVFGGGVDVIPLAQMATILGWRITLVDTRAGYAQAANFPNVHIIHQAANSFEVRELLHSIDAAIVMTHNIEMDAAAISALQNSSARYLGLLGPAHRKQKVLAQANVDANSISVFGPMGLNIGGDLPEAVALATLAECHQVLEASVADFDKKVEQKTQENISPTLRQVV